MEGIEESEAWKCRLQNSLLENVRNFTPGKQVVLERYKEYIADIRHNKKRKGTCVNQPERSMRAGRPIFQSMSWRLYERSRGRLRMCCSLKISDRRSIGTQKWGHSDFHAVISIWRWVLRGYMPRWVRLVNSTCRYHRGVRLLRQASGMVVTMVPCCLFLYCFSSWCLLTEDDL